MEESTAPRLVVAFRGQKQEFALYTGLTVEEVKARLIEREPEALQLVPYDLKLLFKGKVFDDNQKGDLLQMLEPAGKQVYKMMAMGRSSNEVNEIQEKHAEAMKQAPRIRDDLTKQGQRDMERRKRLGRHMLQQASAKASQSPPSSTLSFGFGQVQTLPNLPNETKAREILTKLANDPGVLACMKQQNWRVGALKEMYPEGKVGESAVCVMGLNRNKGQEMLLRVRTDDLKGFRKMLSIRKVLFHELAHNVHSEHDGKFFQLMRQIEKECNDLHWTHGHGLSENSVEGSEDTGLTLYSGGTYRLGGYVSNNIGNSTAPNSATARELRARAALSRMTREEEEIELHCGCGQEALFLPASSQMTNEQGSDGDTIVDMDTS